jgi:pantothenate synthetase
MCTVSRKGAGTASVSEMVSSVGKTSSMDTRIAGLPPVREENGLASSSLFAYLSKEERHSALSPHQEPLGGPRK